ncbi:MAG: class I SAM-dependent methyltransferase [Cyclobacteriaceae bacterium]
MKDRFSAHASQYATFRPSYPDRLVEFVIKHCRGHARAWDCGTGNGQLAVKLSPYFQQVCATDASAKQIENAISVSNINYIVQPAEQTNFPDSYFDLISVAQAIHWFDLGRFYLEVKRVSKPGAVLAVIGYSPLRAGAEFDQIIDDFYFNVINPYWDTERKLVDDRYQSLAFPFQEIQVPAFQMNYVWTKKQVEGYLSSWSAVQTYIQKNHINPVIEVMKKLERCWTAEKRAVYFPIFMRMGLVYL